jgi:hypothetical protein
VKSFTNCTSESIEAVSKITKNIFATEKRPSFYSFWCAFSFKSWTVRRRRFACAGWAIRASLSSTNRLNRWPEAADTLTSRNPCYKNLAASSVLHTLLRSAFLNSPLQRGEMWPPGVKLAPRGRGERPFVRSSVLLKIDGVNFATNLDYVDLIWCAVL